MTCGDSVPVENALGSECSENGGEQFIASCDVGSTSVRCFIYKLHNGDLSIDGSAQQKLDLVSPKAGYVEVDAEYLWESCVEVIKNALKSCGMEASKLKCLGITTQRSTFLVWDQRTQKPLTNLIVWNDYRAEPLVEQWNKSWLMKGVRLGSSLMYYLLRDKRYLAASILTYKTDMSNIKLKWVLEHVTEVQEPLATGNLCFGTLDTWLVYRLTGGELYATDPSNASGTAIFDPYLFKWSTFLHGLLSYGKCKFPQIRNTNGLWAYTDETIFGTPIPITAVVSDQGAALFGNFGFEKGDLKMTLGTGAFLDINTNCEPHTSINGIYPVIGWKDDEGTVYMAEGASSDNGSIIEWGMKIGLYEDPSKTSEMALSVNDSDGVFFIPVFQGIQAPVNDPLAAGGFLGIRITTTPEHMVRAMLEALSFRVYQIFLTMKNETRFTIPKLRLDGGVSQNDFLLQTIATLTNCPVERPVNIETSCLGCCLLAGLGAGIWRSRREVLQFRQLEKTFLPDRHQRQYLLKAYDEWRRALDRFSGWYPKKKKKSDLT